VVIRPQCEAAGPQREGRARGALRVGDMEGERCGRVAPAAMSAGDLLGLSH
jgi:hypothetical protein